MIRVAGGRRAGSVRGVIRKPVQGTLSLVRRRAQPTAFTIVRLAVTAVGAFLVARLFVQADVLAPLTALLVVQATLYRTFRSALQRVVSVTAGVLVAVGLSDLLGFTWWSLGITIAAALAVGYALRLGDSILEVPISAMLILALPASSVVTERILATLVGAATGLVSNLLLAPLRVQPAEEAVDDLARRLADLLETVADDLAAGRGPQRVGVWVERARELTIDLDQVEDALGQAEESVRLNPRRTRVVDPRVYHRRRLEALATATLTVRGIARALNDSVGLAEEVSPLRDPVATNRIAELLRELAAVLRPYGSLARSRSVDRDALKSDIDQHLAEADRRQRALTDFLRAESTASPAGWQLKGELVSHLDRLRTSLEPPPPQADAERAAAEAAGEVEPPAARVDPTGRIEGIGRRDVPARAAGRPPTLKRWRRSLRRLYRSARRWWHH